MVEFGALNWEGWLEDAAFFPSKPSNSLNLDELLPTEKAGSKDDLITGIPDLDWLDAKVDLSIFNPDCNAGLNDAFNTFLDSVVGDSDTFCLPSDTSKANTIDDFNLNLPCIDGQATSEINSFTLDSPFYESISEPSSPASFLHVTPIEFCPSPANTASSSAFSVEPAAFIEACLSPDVASSSWGTPRSSISEDYFSGDDHFNTEDLCPTIQDFLSIRNDSQQSDDSFVEQVPSEYLPPEPSVYVQVVAEEVIAPPVEETLSIEEVAASVKRRKFVNNGRGIPKVHVSLKNMFRPYERTSSRKPRDKVERKKVQNKEAAARYRFKKRIEEQELVGDVATLESEQMELQKKHDGLVSEIKYLKSLMREVLQKKGVLK